MQLGIISAGIENGGQSGDDTAAPPWPDPYSLLSTVKPLV